ncbi:MAG: TIR domain-containing protein, partial [Candidatus Poribacteria bacterium]|nr:TIR domain-containing protein [Candidatus Poribacteria bacterium]
ADRLIFRGDNSSLEYQSWARSFHFVVKVRDYEFWSTPKVKESLKEALMFMSGDRAYHFTFQSGHSTPQTGLFDDGTYEITPQPNSKVILFSGGLDSLAGVVEQLEHSSDQLWLISHQSGQPKTIKTQRQLIKALGRFYPNRTRHYKFHCSLRGIRAKEESQRTRAFLYTSIGYALSCVLPHREIFVYENGITSINFPKRQDQMNARASRTTHPKTIALLENLYSEIEESKISITTPYLWKTKTDIFRTLGEFGRKGLITSTVSCSQTLQHLGQATHCGGCSQCIDRRFAAYGSELDDVDEGGIYGFDFIKDDIQKSEVRTTLMDYFRQAKSFVEWNLDNFSRKMFNELVDLIDYVPGLNDEEKVEEIWRLCRRHGMQVEAASRRMRDIHDDNLYRELPEKSFLQMIAERTHLTDSIQQGQSELMRSKSYTNGMEIFCAYSHEDEELREKLGKHLAPLRRQGIITDWYDRKISAGKEWKGEIDEHLNAARVILLLVSSDFIDSDYCYDVELRRALEMHKAGEARVIPIILRPVDWQILQFANLLALPKDGRAVTLWENQDEAFTDVAKGIAKVVEELNQT